MRWVGLIAGLVAFSIFGAGAEAGDEHSKLIRVIRTDSAYKVRMQAIRVLLKTLEKTKERPTDEIMAALSTAATEDEEHLVRGMACAALGGLSDPRGEAALHRAMADPDEFVRQQAKEALGKLSTSKAVLVISTDRVPGVSSSDELEQALRSGLERGFQTAALGRYVVGDRNGSGYHMKGSVSELSVTPGDAGASQVTVGVKIAIATWPDNNLRHVMSARASARAKVAGPSLIRLQLKLLEAAVNKAIQDSMAQIGG